MAKYEYIAINQNGTEVTGIVDAIGKDDAIMHLRTLNLFPTQVAPEGQLTEAIKQKQVGVCSDADAYLRRVQQHNENPEGYIERLDAMLQIVRDECIRASNKYGPLFTWHHARGVLEEEIQELDDEIRANDSNKAGDEAIQCAAVLVRALIDFQQG